MTPRRALQIMFSVWGSKGVINSFEAKETDDARIGDETALDTVCRIAGINLSDIKPFDPNAWQRIRSLIALRELWLIRNHMYY